MGSSARRQPKVVAMPLPPPEVEEYRKHMAQYRRCHHKAQSRTGAGAQIEKYRHKTLQKVTHQSKQSAHNAAVNKSVGGAGILVRGIPGNVLFGHNPSPDPGKENASCQIAQQDKTQIPKHTFFTS